jgi:small subunit ribosomal protein S11
MVKSLKKINLKKTKRKTLKGIIHIQASFNNTIVTVTDTKGQVISWSSAGAAGFKGAKKSTSFAAQIATENAIKPLIDQGMQQSDVMISGPGPGRDTSLRTIKNSGIIITVVKDVTPIPHNGCRPPCKRRI